MKNNNFYYKDDKTYIRVTNVIAQIEKFGLHSWMINCALNYVAQEIDRHRLDLTELNLDKILSDAKTEHRRQGDHAMFIGQADHHFIHEFATGQEFKEPDLMEIPEVSNAYQSHLQWKEDFKVETVNSELTVYNEELEYAGTIDEIDWVTPPKKKKAMLYIVDYKVSNRLYHDQMIMQLAAYKRACELEIEGVAAVRLDKEKIKYEWREYSKKEERLGWQMFKCLLAFGKLKKEMEQK